MKTIQLLLLFMMLPVLLFSKQNSVINSESYSYDAKTLKQIEKEVDNYVKAMIVVDYEVISLPQNGSIDLLGTHYLQQLNDWLYFGIGAHAPLFKGEYGGFMAFDATFHLQHKIYDNIFVNAGVSLGGGGGGSSVAQSKKLSGTGGFIKSYAGVGYEFDNNISLGVNYTNFKFINSQIDSSQFNFFVAVPFSYSVGSYAEAGTAVDSIVDYLAKNENIFSLELNNLFQINPTATTKETINNIAFQYSHFLNDDYYLYMNLEVGYKGLPLYNQLLHGVGKRTSLSSELNLYTQIAVGSGGYSPNNIDTGSGLLINPKISLEYMLNDAIGIGASGGYLYAPTGTSKNYTAAIALNYHLSNKRGNHSLNNKELKYKGFRFSIFPQTEFSVKLNNKEFHNINMIAIQLDNLIDDNFYFATQASIAYNEYQGYPGYGEALVGLGVQNKFTPSNKFQSFAQFLMGTNIHGIVIKPSIGTTYSFSDRYALYAQVGYIKSVNQKGLYRQNQSMSAYSAGAGVSYRFSLY